jgi:teichuronic acid biosynthesis glycosyltransferase TuaG
MTLPKPPNIQQEFADVSVVIPAYNARDSISRALASIATQTLRPREVIVVDDGSDDGTYEAIQEFKSRMNGVSLAAFKQDNRGAGAARNRALNESTQPIIAFLDADDEWLPEKLEHSLHHMNSGNYTLVGHNGFIVENGQESIIDGAGRFREGPSPYVSLYKKGYLDTCTIVANRDALIAAGGFDESLPNAQDFDLWLRVLEKPETKFLVFDDVLSRYHVTPGSIMSHTERRLSCCLDIAGRFAASLRAHSGTPLKGLWFRILAVYFEAAQTYLARKDYPLLVFLCLRLPISFAVRTLAYILPTAPKPGPIAVVALYVWIGGALTAYLYQYRDMADSILRAIGIG